MVDFSIEIKTHIDDSFEEVKKKMVEHFKTSNDYFRCRVTINLNAKGEQLKLEPIIYEVLATKEEYLNYLSKRELKKW